VDQTTHLPLHELLMARMTETGTATDKAALRRDGVGTMRPPQVAFGQ
jgi:hypothetical protein